ncbi:MAG: hypothetical protein QXI16_03745 [Sulfolobaceae archaeon]
MIQNAKSINKVLIYIVIAIAITFNVMLPIYATSGGLAIDKLYTGLTWKIGENGTTFNPVTQANLSNFVNQLWANTNMLVDYNRVYIDNYDLQYINVIFFNEAENVLWVEVNTYSGKAVSSGLGNSLGNPIRAWAYDGYNDGNKLFRQRINVFEFLKFNSDIMVALEEQGISQNYILEQIYDSMQHGGYSIAEINYKIFEILQDMEKETKIKDDMQSLADDLAGGTQEDRQDQAKQVADTAKAKAVTGEQAEGVNIVLSMLSGLPTLGTLFAVAGLGLAVLVLVKKGMS